MLVTQGDLWTFAKYGWIVVPTNLDVRKDGLAVMGRGVARQASGKVRGLREYYGAAIREGKRSVEPLVMYGRGAAVKLVLLPVKHHWYQPASLGLIERSAQELAAHPRIAGQVFLPVVGAGYGQLDADEVLEVLKRHLGEDRFVVVRRGEDVEAKYPVSFREGRFKDASLGAA